MDRAIGLGAIIALGPVVKPLILVDMVDPAPLALDEEAFGRAQDVVIERRHGVADRRLAREPGRVANGLLRHPAARAVDPAQRLGVGGVDIERSVHAEFLVGHAAVHEALEAPTETRTRQVARRAGGEALGDPAVLVVMLTPVSEQSPGQRDDAGIAHALEEVGQGARALVNGDELVHVHHADPVGCSDRLLPHGVVQRTALGFLAGVAIVRIVEAGDMAHVLQPV